MTYFHISPGIIPRHLYQFKNCLKIPKKKDKKTCANNGAGIP